MPKVNYGKEKIKYVSPKEFMAMLSLSKTMTYDLFKRPELQEAIIKVSEKEKRINPERAIEIMQQIF